MNYNEGINLIYVGNILNHGDMAAEWASGFLIASSFVDRIKNIDVICPEKSGDETINYSDKINVLSTYNVNSIMSILYNLKLLMKKNPDLIIFNTNPTYIGKKLTTNLLGQILPIILKIFKKNVFIIRHSSVYTNNFQKLGFFSFSNKFKASFLKIIEFLLFSIVPTYFLLEIYTSKIKKTIKTAKVKTMINEYLESLPTLYQNDLIDITNPTYLKVKKPENKIAKLWIHGFWGPQKDLGEILEVLNKIKKKGYYFEIYLSGKVNQNFPKYEEKFTKIIQLYSDIIFKNYGYLHERDLYDLLLSMDLALLPYSASGGHSGVLELASAFDLDVFISNYPEYVEKKKLKNFENINVIELNEFQVAIESYLEKFSPKIKEIDLGNKIATSLTHVNNFYSALLN